MKTMRKERQNIKEILSLKSILITLLFGATNSLACWLFVVPNNFANSGIEGIGVMVQYVTGFNVGYFQLIVNVPLCIFAYICVNKKFAVNTVLYTISYSVFYRLFVFLNLEPFKYYTEGINTIYAVIITGIITGISYGVLFIESSSTGGVDIINDLNEILLKADIKRIFVNGKTAEKYYKIYTEKSVKKKAVCLPSTSPANAVFTLDKLVEKWKIIKSI